MRAVPLLHIDDAKLFDQFRAAKHPPRRARLAKARASVLEAYQRYRDATPEVGGLDLAALTEPQKEALRHSFTVETAPMTALRGAILERIAVARCPFCGLSETSTLDHYLPKETYPEFAIFSANLVPCCPLCNTRKRDKILDEATDVRLFVHPHFDVVPDVQFLQVRIVLEEGAIGLTFRLIRPEGMALASFQHLRSHFGLLNLADRYRRMSLEHLGGQYRAIRRDYGDSEDAGRVAEELSHTADDAAEHYGDNYWLAVLYRALAAHDDFCNGGFEVLNYHH